MSVHALVFLVLAIAPDSSALEWWARLGHVFEDGQALYAKGDYVAAARRYGEAMPANPFACLHNRALCHARHGAWVLASRDLMGAAEMALTRAQRARALVGLGAVRLRQGQIEPANAALLEAAELGANDAYAWLNLASVHEARERFREALEAIDRATPLSSELRDDVAIWRALVAHRLGDEPRLLEIDPTNAANWGPAVERLSRALSLRPDFRAARVLLADIAQRARERDAAEIASGAELVLERDRASLASSPRQPCAWLDLETVPGEPTDPTEPSRWEDYAHRWELLVLLGIVVGILAIYLRVKAAKAKRAA